MVKDGTYNNDTYFCRCPYCQTIMGDYHKCYFCKHCGVYIIKDTGRITYNPHEIF